MSEHYTKEVQRFKAQGADGKQIELVLSVDMVVDRTRAGTSKSAGMKTIKTTDGRSVNRKAQGRYELVATGQILTSDDPNAP